MGKNKTPIKKPFIFYFLLPAVLILIAAITYYSYCSSLEKERKELAALKGGETEAVLPASQFTGRAKQAYELVAKDPELQDYLFCYCYCKDRYGHKSLKSCFITDHAANCGICIDEAIMAYEMRQKGAIIKEIRKTIDKHFGKMVEVPSHTPVTK